MILSHLGPGNGRGPETLTLCSHQWLSELHEVKTVTHCILVTSAQSHVHHKTSRKTSEVVLPRVPTNVVMHPWYKAHPQVLLYNLETLKCPSEDVGNALLKAEERRGPQKSLVTCGLAAHGGFLLGVTV